MAIKDYTAPSQEQMQIAFSEIARIAHTLQKICHIDTGKDIDRAYILDAVQQLSKQIGWIADRQTGFDETASEEWLRPRKWLEKIEVLPGASKELHHD